MNYILSIQQITHCFVVIVMHSNQILLNGPFFEAILGINNNKSKYLRFFLFPNGLGKWWMEGVHLMYHYCWFQQHQSNPYLIQQRGWGREAWGQMEVICCSKTI